MADTTARTMRLLTLLQRRRYWPGPELARRLEVSERTLRRDVDRLRALGYSVNSDRGVDGGYQLDSTHTMAPLLVDNDEAVALAVGLKLAAQGTPELAEASVGALAKVLALLPPDQRRRAESVREVSVGFGPSTTGPTLDVLATTAAACRDGVRLSFEYHAANGDESERYVEPYGVVAFGSRYYLVAFDLDRSDWRTFRLDRLATPTPARTPFTRRPLPLDDLREYVRAAQRNVPGRHHVVIDVDRPAALMRDRYGRWVEVAELAAHRCRLTMEVDDFTWPLHIVAGADADFEIREPPELQRLVAAFGARAAGSGTERAIQASARTV